MTTLVLSLLIGLVLFGATWLGGRQIAHAAGSIEPTRSDLRQAIQLERGKADRFRRNRCLHPRGWGELAGLWRRQLAHRLDYAQRYKRFVLRERGWGQCWEWYRSSGFRCIREHEGAWGDPNPPYWGGVQADLSFQAAYGGNWLRRFGTADHWLPRYQAQMAWRGWRARGFQPWPNTSVMCGLR